MTDIHSKETRSYNMSRISGKNTKPELLVRKFLFSKGFRYKVHDKRLPGKPDIVLPKHKTVVFIHGCFWHGHDNCMKFTIPKTRTEWWTHKIGLNKINDLKHQKSLISLGWNVIYIWTCQLNKSNLSETLNRCIDELKDSKIQINVQSAQYRD